ncbi:MAG: hypothetical protein JW795_17510 [Chitinivibrionales bacterium]|nr:hypothetical protein [Chitinivibrionales bacterium]
MNKTYTVHQSIFLVENSIRYGFFSIIMIFLAIPYLLSDELVVYRPQLIQLSIYISLTLVCILLLISIGFNEVKKTFYILSPDGIIHKTPYKLIPIEFNDVVRFSYTFLPFGFSFAMLKSSSNKKMYIGSAVENLTDLIEDICSLLRSHDKQSTFDEKRMERFIQQAKVTDFHAYHAIKTIKPLLLVCASSGLLSTLVTLFLWEIPSFFSLLWTIYGLLFPLTGYIIAHIALNSVMVWHLRHQKDFQEQKWIKTIYTYVGVFTALTYLACGILFRSLWMYYYLGY